MLVVVVDRAWYAGASEGEFCLWAWMMSGSTSVPQPSCLFRIGRLWQWGPGCSIRGRVSQAGGDPAISQSINHGSYRQSHCSTAAVITAGFGELGSSN